jgi:ABC-type glycerol-3-phosphate transport system substrate-binding protein
MPENWNKPRLSLSSLTITVTAITATSATAAAAAATTTTTTTTTTNNNNNSDINNIIIKDKNEKILVLINVAIPADRNVIQKRAEEKLNTRIDV